MPPYVEASSALQRQLFFLFCKNVTRASLEDAVGIVAVGANTAGRGGVYV